jgi:hypothetical protein
VENLHRDLQSAVDVAETATQLGIGTAAVHEFDQAGLDEVRAAARGKQHQWAAAN